MTTITQRFHGHAATAEDASPLTVSPVAARALATLRIAFGFTFMWAFLDKAFALGHDTGKDAATGAVDRFGPAAWVNGGSPTKGFLAFGADGPFSSFYHSIAGAAWVDWLFMLALLGIGIALILGIGMRAAATAGVVLYLMMWTVVLPPANNPIIDDHILGAISLVVLAALSAGNTWGLGRIWNRSHVVQEHPVLR
jgi:thiosulfate dehydrogenase [quinone] large subunit